MGADYVRLDGLEVANSNAYCILVSNDAIRLELLNLDVHNCGTPSAGAGAIIFYDGTTPAYTIIRGNRVHDNYWGGIVLFCVPGGYYLIEQNTVYNNQGTNNWDAIQVGGGDELCGTHHVVVRKNVVSGTSQGDNLDMGGRWVGTVGVRTSHYLMEDNETYGGSAGGVKFSGLGLDWAIMRRNRVTGESITFYSPPYRATVYHNTIVSGYHDLQFWRDIGFDPGPHPTFRNNLFTQSTNALINVGGALLPDLTYPTSLDMDADMFLFSGGGINWGNTGYGTTQSEFDSWRSTTGQEPNGKRITQSLSQIYVDPANRDYRLLSGSPAIDAGVHLTRTTSAGSGTVIPVQKSWYFHDGYNGLVAPDTIQIGSNAPVAITSIDYLNDRITVATSISWNANDGVSLPYNGSAPDIGAFEYGGTQTPQCSDGIDNDGDGLTDYPADPGCTSSSDNDETNTAPDTTPPVRTNGAPTGTLPAGTTQATLSLNTDENATCKWGSATGQSYTNMPNTFSTTGGTSHATGVSALTNGSNYTIYFRCRDTAGNANTTDYSVSFNIANPPASALIAHWTLDETSGTTAVDSATADGAQNGTLANGPLWTTGKIGGAVQFDGADDYIQVADDNTLDVPAGQDATYALWVKSSQAPVLNRWPALLNKEASPQHGFEIILHDSTVDDRWVASFVNAGTTWISAAGLSNIADGNWHHVVAVKSGDTLSTYQDGVFAHTVTNSLLSTVDFSNTNPLCMGRFRCAGTSTLYGGYIDDVRLYNYALTPEQIQALFSGGGTKSADLNGDGTVNSLDWSIMNAAWGTNNTAADLDSDGVVNSLDWSVMNGRWGTGG